MKIHLCLQGGQTYDDEVPPSIGQCSVIHKQTELHSCLGGKSDGYEHNEQYWCHVDTGAAE